MCGMRPLWPCAGLCGRRGIEFGDEGGQVEGAGHSDSFLLVLRVDRVQRSFLGRLFEQYVYYVGLSLFVYFLCT